jgi:ribosomal protein S18 acetylase RimI-like enzyme
LKRRGFDAIFRNRIGAGVVSSSASRAREPGENSPVPCTKPLSPVEGLDTPAALRPRPARSEEIAALVELDRLCFGSRAWSPRAWWEVVLFPEWTTLVLERDGELAAASVLLPGAPVSWLASLAVRPRYRRTGLGRTLLRDAVARARGASARWLSLEVDRANPSAIALYRREGFALLRRFREEGRWRQEMVRRLGGRRGV